MSRNRIAFIVITAVFALGTLPGAVMNLLQPPMVAEMMDKLSLPLHLLTLLGVWKLLGIVALAAPAKYRRIKEWAYAGFFFDLSGAAYLHGAVADFEGMVPSLGLLVLLVGSYLLRSKEDASTPQTQQELRSPQAYA